MASSFTYGEIHLEENPPVYYAGQVISGTVVFKLNEPLTFSAIYVQFLGTADVLWSEYEKETVNGMTSDKWVKYVGKEEYINFTQTLAGGLGSSQLPPGRQEFPFRYQIPFGVPSSFDGQLGKISYRIIARMVYPNLTADSEEIVKDFNVVAPFDLNTGGPQLKEPIDFEFEDEYGCGCCCFGSNGPVTLRIRLPASGFVPGQAIPVAVDVQNNSNTEITKIIFDIVTKELYRSQQPGSENIPPEKIIATTKTKPVMGRTKRNFTCDVVVPEFIPPFLERCSIIDVGYFFRVTIKFSGCTDDEHDENEIYLGLVPLRELVDGEYIHPMSHSLPKAPIPINNTPPQLAVPVNATFGSNTSIHRSQYTAVNATFGSKISIHKSQYTTVTCAPPPYPGNNAPYPINNTNSRPVSMEMRPAEYGFKSPAADLPYPNYGTPYPGAAVGGSTHGLPQANPANSGSSPMYNPGTFAPSAPPPL